MDQEIFQKQLKVAMYRKVGLDRWFVQLGLVGVHLNFVGVRRERLPVIADLTNVEPGPQDQKQIRILHRKVSRALTDRPRTAAEQGIVRRDQIVGPRGGDRYL